MAFEFVFVLNEYMQLSVKNGFFEFVFVLNEYMQLSVKNGF